MASVAARTALRRPIRPRPAGSPRQSATHDPAKNAGTRNHGTTAPRGRPLTAARGKRDPSTYARITGTSEKSSPRSTAATGAATSAAAATAPESASAVSRPPIARDWPAADQSPGAGPANAQQKKAQISPVPAAIARVAPSEARSRASQVRPRGTGL